jgi:hypothetical protein
MASPPDRGSGLILSVKATRSAGGLRPTLTLKICAAVDLISGATSLLAPRPPWRAGCEQRSCEAPEMRSRPKAPAAPRRSALAEGRKGRFFSGTRRQPGDRDKGGNRKLAGVSPLRIGGSGGNARRAASAALKEEERGRTRNPLISLNLISQFW